MREIDGLQRRSIPHSKNYLPVPSCSHTCLHHLDLPPIACEVQNGARHRAACCGQMLCWGLILALLLKSSPVNLCSHFPVHCTFCNWRGHSQHIHCFEATFIWLYNPNPQYHRHTLNTNAHMSLQRAACIRIAICTCNAASCFELMAIEVDGGRLLRRRCLALSRSLCRQCFAACGGCARHTCPTWHLKRCLLEPPALPLWHLARRP